MVMNVKQVSFDAAITFSETKDHAKWAASPATSGSNRRNPFVTCIGDINRMESQRNRGGGAVSLRIFLVFGVSNILNQTCIINPSLNAAFNNLASEIDAC